MDKRLSVFSKTLCVCLALGFAVPTANAAAASDPLMADQWALADPSAIGAQGGLDAVDRHGRPRRRPRHRRAARPPRPRGEHLGATLARLPATAATTTPTGSSTTSTARTCSTSNGNVNDDNGHGTHVAGVVAARQGNGVGGSGIAPDAEDPAGQDSRREHGRQHRHARLRHPLRRRPRSEILNVSVNTDAPTDTVRDAVRYAGEHGAVVVASSGNNGRNIDLKPSYPASLADPAVFAVAAQDEDGLLSDVSNTGLASVDLAAPGVHITSTTRNSSYQSRTGTSAAAPFVAGSLALLSAARPDLPISDLRAIVAQTTRRTGLLGSLLGGGHLDVGAAMHRALAGRAVEDHSGRPRPGRPPGAAPAHDRQGPRRVAGDAALDRDRRPRRHPLARLARRPGHLKTVPASAAGVSRRVARAVRQARVEGRRIRRHRREGRRRLADLPRGSPRLSDGSHVATRGHIAGVLALQVKQGLVTAGTVRDMTVAPPPLLPGAARRHGAPRDVRRPRVPRSRTARCTSIATVRSSRSRPAADAPPPGFEGANRVDCGRGRGRLPGPHRPAQPHRLQLPRAVDRAGALGAVDGAPANGRWTRTTCPRSRSRSTRCARPTARRS